MSAPRLRYAHLQHWRHPMTNNARRAAVEAAAFAYMGVTNRSVPMDAIRAALAAYDHAMAEAGWVRVPRKILTEAHACMRATGWHLAMGPSHHGSDGVLEAACSDVEDRFAAMLAGRGDGE